MLQVVAKLLWRKFNKCCMYVYMYVRLHLYTENHQLNILLSFKKTKIYLQLLYMIAEWETDMLDSFLKWAKDPTFLSFWESYSIMWPRQRRSFVWNNYFSVLARPKKKKKVYITFLRLAFCGVWLMVVGQGYKSWVVGVGVGVSNITN